MLITWNKRPRAMSFEQKQTISTVVVDAGFVRKKLIDFLRTSQSSGCFELTSTGYHLTDHNG